MPPDLADLDLQESVRMTDRSLSYLIRRNQVFKNAFYTDATDRNYAIRRLGPEQVVGANIPKEERAKTYVDFRL